MTNDECYEFEVQADNCMQAWKVAADEYLVEHKSLGLIEGMSCGRVSELKSKRAERLGRNE